MVLSDPKFEGVDLSGIDEPKEEGVKPMVVASEALPSLTGNNNSTGMDAFASLMPSLPEPSVQMNTMAPPETMNLGLVTEAPNGAIQGATGIPDLAVVPPANDSSAEWVPTDREVSVGKHLFEIADVENLGKLSGPSAVKFLVKSGIDRTILRHIWELSDTAKHHALGPDEFQIALRYVSLSQNGHTLSPSILQETKGLVLSDPKFEGVDLSGISEPRVKPDAVVVEEAEVDPFAALGDAMENEALPALGLHASTVGTEDVCDDEFGDFEGVQEADPSPNSLEGDEVASNEEAGDEDNFGDFAEAAPTVPPTVDEATVAENASMIDSFVVQESKDGKKPDIFSNLSEFAFTGAPISPTAFGHVQPGEEDNTESYIGETDLSFLPSMQNFFDGSLEDLTTELIRQERFRAALECQLYTKGLGDVDVEDRNRTKRWRECPPNGSLVTFSTMKVQVEEICGKESLLVRRFCQLFPFTGVGQKQDLIALAMKDLENVLALFKKAKLLVRVIEGINGDDGEYKQHPKHWLAVLSHCKSEFEKAQSFLSSVKAGVEAYNTGNLDKSFSHTSITKVLKTEKVSAYFQCMFAMFKVCCSLQLWTVNTGNALRKSLLGEMEILKKQWKSMAIFCKKFNYVFPKLKMITFKHVHESEIVAGENQLCHLSLLPICKGDSQTIYAGKCYLTACANYWLNNISLTAPSASQNTDSRLRRDSLPSSPS